MTPGPHPASLASSAAGSGGRFSNVSSTRRRAGVRCVSGFALPSSAHPAAAKAHSRWGRGGFSAAATPIVMRRIMPGGVIV